MELQTPTMLMPYVKIESEIESARSGQVLQWVMSHRTINDSSNTAVDGVVDLPIVNYGETTIRSVTLLWPCALLHPMGFAASIISVRQRKLTNTRQLHTSRS